MGGLRPTGVARVEFEVARSEARLGWVDYEPVGWVEVELGLGQAGVA